ncbi:hypothetical protein JK358_11850 [Nocardia sp. 2]|uniref:Anti-sigma-D factor RsdA sigma factor binding region domain-containing protein n=1 Tax=Nocardia acididurans TaxID=2802282 RepID=A0ABS1M352_9NOCA|nr:anti-sigma-D factor RsdA [Nocardia acididurans]MBL1075087.1 hypothetical protein [Nocardia acididurans]
MARDGERGRGDWKARSGSHNSGPYAEASGDTGPVDITAVRRDDALIDAISGDGPVQTGTEEEYQLAALLANWRAEILAEPMPAGPDLDAVVAAVNQEIGARQARISAHTGGRLRLLRPIAGAAAAIALVIGGMTAFSYSAAPGDPLWRVKEVVFSEQAQSTVVQLADDDLATAKQYISEGKPELAAPYMERAASNVGQVNDPGKKDKLQDQWQQLLTTLATVAPEVAKSIDPSAPTTPPGQVTTPPKETTVPNQGGSGGTTTDPRILGVDPTDPNTGGGTTPGGTTGGVTTLPVTPPVVTTPPTTDPATPPTNGGNISTPAGEPTGGQQTGAPEITVPPAGEVPANPPTVEKPISVAPVVPSGNSLPTNGGIVPPTVPNSGGTP